MRLSFGLTVLVAWLAKGTLGALAATAGPPVDIEHLTLTTAEQLFLAHSRELLAAKRAVDAARADQVAAAQRPNPQLSLSVSSIPPRNTAGFGGPVWEKGVNTVVGMTQLIERGGKRELRTEAAQRVTEATQNDLVDTLVQQKSAFKSAFFNLLQTSNVRCGNVSRFQSQPSRLNRLAK